MLSAEAMRLAAFEVLAPTAARLGQDGATFPTLAGHRVYDSRAAAVSELGDDERGYTPVISLFTPDSRLERRGAAAAAWDNDCEATLEIVAELAVVVQPSPDDEDGEPYVDALAATDGAARLVLAALLAQIRYLLEFAEAGYLFRRAIVAVKRIEERTLSLPELGLRWHRTLMTITAQASNDEFEDAGGLPEPLRTLDDMLPEGSLAKQKIADLAAAFAGQTRTPLKVVTASDPRTVGDPPAPIWPTLGVDIP